MSPDPPAPSHLAKRSRAALERLLTAAQEVLATQGFDAASPHRAEISHPSPTTALTTAMRTILAAGAHRATAPAIWRDGLSWAEWSDEITAMTSGYLTRS